MRRRRPSVRAGLRREVVWRELTRRNMTQNELARRVDISSGYLSQLMSGERCGSARVRARLQQELEIPEFDDLFVLEAVA